MSAKDDENAKSGRTDTFAEFGDNIAAHVRQWSRAQTAGDGDAIRWQLAYLRHYLKPVLPWYLRLQDPAWAKEAGRRLESIRTVPPDSPSPDCLRLQGTAEWSESAGRPNHRNCAPVEIEIWLHPESDLFRQLVVRLSDPISS